MKLLVESNQAICQIGNDILILSFFRKDLKIDLSNPSVDSFISKL